MKWLWQIEEIAYFTVYHKTCKPSCININYAHMMSLLKIARSTSSWSLMQNTKSKEKSTPVKKSVWMGQSKFSRFHAKKTSRISPYNLVMSGKA